MVFRTLDVGGDKVLPYLRQPQEENPALGWRAIRLGLDRPGLLRTQVRALLQGDRRPGAAAAAADGDGRRRGRHGARADRSRARPAAAARHAGPTKVLLGVMIEVPSLLYELDALLPRVDFVSVGSNDLLQYFFAADRNNTRVAARYDALSAAPLRALAAIVDAAGQHDRPLSLCGEMAGRPLEAMALIGLGYRSISMAPASVGPVKSMILSLDAGELQRWLRATIHTAEGNVRAQLKRYAEDHGVEI